MFAGININSTTECHRKISGRDVNIFRITGYLNATEKSMAKIRNLSAR